MVQLPDFRRLSQVGASGADIQQSRNTNCSGANAAMTRQTRVLIVDDAEDNREVYAEYLRYRGFAVTEAATGAEALLQVFRVDPDVMLLDMRLPDVNGADVSRRLRTLQASRPTIIALSACVFDSDITTALGSGCDAFLAKPCLPETLEMEIRRLVPMPLSA
jgi:two-component system, cell cycle response regulator DivK